MVGSHGGGGGGDDLLRLDLPPCGVPPSPLTGVMGAARRGLSGRVISLGGGTATE